MPERLLAGDPSRKFPVFRCRASFLMRAASVPIPQGASLLVRTIFLLVFLLLPAVAWSERRIALVIGNEDYDQASNLGNPVSDAVSVADHLEGLGFAFVLETNRDTRQFRRALRDFAEDAEGAAVALVYFAGHGLEVNGGNRLLATDVAFDSLDALEKTTVPLSDVADLIKGIAPAAILLVDACRKDPFQGTPLANLSERSAEPITGDTAATPRLSPGFSRLGRADGLVYAFATAPGATADDGAGDHSPFAAALLRHFGTPGVELRTALTLVQQDVYDRTRGAPYIESALPDLIFVAGTIGVTSERDILLLARPLRCRRGQRTSCRSMESAARPVMSARLR